MPTNPIRLRATHFEPTDHLISQADPQLQSHQGPGRRADLEVMPRPDKLLAEGVDPAAEVGCQCRLLGKV